MGPVARLCSLLALVATVPACDQVFGLDKPAVTTPCGVFGEPHSVAIDPRLSNPARLSFTTPDTVGIVAAVLDKSPTSDAVKRTDYAVMWDAAQQMWMYDAARSTGLPSLANSAAGLRHTASTRDPNRLFGSVNTNDDGVYHLYPLTPSDAGWVTATQEVSESLQASAYAGRELVDSPGSSNEQSTVPVFRTDLGTLSKVVALAVRAPTRSSWIDEKDGGTLSTDAINDEHWPTAGALARVNGQQVLIYAARPASVTVGSDLFYSVRESGSFQVPQPLAMLDTDQEEIEPWIDEQCTTLTFRRTDPNNRHDDDFDGDTVSGGTIYQAEIVKPPEPQ